MTELEKSIKNGFIVAIRKTFPKPTPLIGDGWFLCPPNGRPADFQFIGVSKLAKATAIPVNRVAQMLVKNLDLGDFPATVEVSKDGRINLNYKPRPAAAAAAVPPPSAPSASGTPAKAAKPANAKPRSKKTGKDNEPPSRT